MTKRYRGRHHWGKVTSDMHEDIRKLATRVTGYVHPTAEADCEKLKARKESKRND